MERAPFKRFGTLEGVFLPCVLSLFGVILFLRTGWVVGNAGLPNAFLILLISTSIAFCTGLSVATLSTSSDVGTGGTYYIISRNLGLDTGGAVGIPLYFSQAISVSFYIIGFLESLSFIKPGINFPLWGTLILIGFSTMVFLGADIAVKFQYVIASLLFLGIASFMATPWRPPFPENLHPHYAANLGFWPVFSVFFPALVGIDAGIGLSGELKEPGKNIPRGITSALLFSTLVYALVMLKASSIASHRELVAHTDIFVKKALIPQLVILGIWAATLSSALTYSMAAPRTLKALAMDGVLPSFFASSMGSKKDEPRLGVLVTFVIAECFVLIGSLNKVASIITMFFLISYGTLNLAAALQGLVANPFYRPSFKAPWYVSAAGFLISTLVMFRVEPISASVALASIAFIFAVLKKRELVQTWGDVRTGLWMSWARLSLLRLERKKLDPMSWRPNLMAFTGNPQTRPYLAQLAHWISRGNGIVTLINLIVGRLTPETKRLAEKRLDELKDFIYQHRWPLFAEVVVVENLVREIPLVVQSHGIGNLYSNVVLFGWGHDPKRENILLRLVRKLAYLDRDILILKHDPERGFGEKRRIDIWWRGGDRNIELMLLIAEILKKNEEWRKARLRVITASDDEDAALKKLKTAIEAMNSSAEPLVVPESDVGKALETYSKDADLTIIGLPIPKEGEEDEVAARINSLVLPLGTVLMVRSLAR